MNIPATLGRRRWFERVVSRAYVLGIISASCWRGGGYGVTWISWRGKRPYVLGFKRIQWYAIPHLLRYRHWPLRVWGGMCGKCGPWQCCGAVGFDHAEGCPEEVAA
jgi:hypothetical protein